MASAYRPARAPATQARRRGYHRDGMVILQTILVTASMIAIGVIVWRLLQAQEKRHGGDKN